MSEITKAMQLLCDEKGLSYEVVLETIEGALAAAYRKDFGNKQQNIKVKFDPETADMKAWDVKTVVADITPEALEAGQTQLVERREQARAENRELTEEETADLPHFNPKTEIMLQEAGAIKKDAKLGEVLEIELPIQGEFGRMAAQTAKQVIIQKVREAERGLVFEDFKHQEGRIIVGTIQRVEARKVLIDLGKITGILPVEEQSRREFYRPGARLKFLVLAVNMGVRGPEIVLSRQHPNMVKEVFTQEVPEINDGSITIANIAREAGFRSKVAVATEDPQIDPIGSCIGQRGGRINTIIEELGGEKIDIIRFSKKDEEYIANALSPAKVKGVVLHTDSKIADVTVPADQFSLAIGRGGQNVRLASELTGWNINVLSEDGTLVAIEPAEDDVAAPVAEENAPIADAAPIEEQTGKIAE